MVHPASRPSRPPASSAGKSLLKKKAPATGRLAQSRLTFSASTEPPAGPSTSYSAPLRQASLFQLPGVVQYSEDDPVDVPTTLYLGEEDIARLRSTLEVATERDDMLKVLRRLSAMPCTRQVLETTRIGVTVGHLRKHADEEIRGLAERIVAVWKRQLKEHTAQKQAVKHQQYSGGGRR